MYKILKLSLLSLLVGLLAAGIFFPSDSRAQASGYIRRNSADFFNFDVTESLTTTGAASSCPGAFPASCVPDTPDGELFFNKTVFVPASDNTMYVILSAVADTHGGSALWISCRINGAFCNPGTGGAAGTPAGWIAVNKLPAPTTSTNCNDGGGGTGDCHDNSDHYTWCVPEAKFAPGLNTVDLKMASSDGISVVFMETAHVFIDSSNIKGRNRCTPHGGTGTEE